MCSARSQCYCIYIYICLHVYERRGLVASQTYTHGAHGMAVAAAATARAVISLETSQREGVRTKETYLIPLKTKNYFRMTINRGNKIYRNDKALLLIFIQLFLFFYDIALALTTSADGFLSIRYIPFSVRSHSLSLSLCLSLSHPSRRPSCPSAVSISHKTNCMCIHSNIQLLAVLLLRHFVSFYSCLIL